MVFLLSVCFFFSSRRRHTRLQGDWSSDVCSSDLVFAIVMLIGFHMRLILGEEAFLREKLGEPYAAYCAKAPRILPALRPQVAASGARPRWGQAALAEIFMWGSAVSFVVLGWRYNTTL